MTDDIRTFSGTHDFHPSVLVDTDAYEEGNADDIIWNIDNGRCPRCEGPLPTMPEFPAGSRITECRSIPVCRRCGEDEVFESMDAACGIGWGLSSAGCWPVPIGEIEARRDRYMERAQPAIIVDGHLITENGAAPVINPRNTGGWAQYGDPGDAEP
ncbi:MAG TPA: hypothetical protein VLL82_15090 [Mycobacterium sp.]|nr:hypothetical protein [Mycobacterium sp.]